MLRILIADDHDVVRKGLKHILLSEFPSAHVQEVADGKSLVQEALRDTWDFILSDITMPELSGILALQKIREVNPTVPIIILSVQTSDQYSKTAFRAGASGYVGKDAAPDKLISVIKRVLKGERQAAAITGNENEAFSGKLPHEHLTIREMEVFKLLANGKALVEIAELLSLSPSTISSFRARILKKTGAANNADLVRYAVENNLL